MAGTAANIVVGSPANIKYVAYGGVEGGAADLGFTQEGAQLIPTMEHFMPTVDQLVGSPVAYRTSVKWQLQFNMAEATLANMLLALGQPTGNLSAPTLKVGGSSTVTEYTLFVNGRGPGSGATRKITIWKAVAVGNPEISMVKEGVTSFTMTFEILQDTSKSEDEQFFKVDDSGVDTTAPTVAFTSPGEDATVAKDGKEVVTFTFTEAGTGMDEGTFIYPEADNATIMIINVTDTADTSIVAGSISYNATTKVLTYTPTANWNGSDKMQIVITTGVKDMAGNNLASTFVAHFTVAV